MLTRPSPMALFVLCAGVVVAAAAPVWGEEIQCQRGDLIRRVVLEFADNADRLPCEVVYWKDTESPDQPQLLWKAEFSTQFCADKARTLVDRLSGAGWRCDDDGEVATAAVARPAATRSVTEPAAAPAAVEVAPAGPRPRARQAPPDTTAAERAIDTVAPEPDPASPEPTTVADAAILDEPAAIEPAAGPPPAQERPRADPTILAAAVARDVQRLDQLTEATPGGFEVEMAMIGDLDDDGADDAAVLMSYRAEGVALEHHLLAYLYDGQTFQPVSRINLAASDPTVGGAEIRNVVGGVVEVQLDVYEPTDPPCCPSGRRAAEFALRDGQLVSLAAEPGA